MSTTYNEYPLGSQVRCSVVFTGADGVAADPTDVTFRLRDPEGAVTIYVYDSDLELIRLSEGSYYVLVTGNISRTWVYRFEGEGAVVAADETRFVIEESVF